MSIYRPCASCVRKGCECVERPCQACVENDKASECTHRKPFPEAAPLEVEGMCIFNLLIQ